MYLLADFSVAQEALWKMLSRGVVQMLPLGAGDVPRMRELMRKYIGRPMDLADAAIVAVAERDNVRKVFTTDKKDFGIYRLHGRSRFTII